MPVAEMVQLNVRIDAETKRQGDAILRQAGLTSSQYMRQQWERLVEDGVPSQQSQENDNDATERIRKAKIAESTAGLAVRLAQKFGLAVVESTEETYDDMRDAMYDEKLATYDAQSEELLNA